MAPSVKVNVWILFKKLNCLKDETTLYDNGMAVASQ